MEPTTVTTVAGALANVDLSGIFSQLLAVLPIILPTIVAFIGFRKALSFVLGSLRSA